MPTPLLKRKGVSISSLELTLPRLKSLVFLLLLEINSTEKNFRDKQHTV